MARKKTPVSAQSQLPIEVWPETPDADAQDPEWIVGHIVKRDATGRPKAYLSIAERCTKKNAELFRNALMEYPDNFSRIDGCFVVIETL